MQLVVGGRTSPSSADIIESLKVLIEHGADVNYVPRSSEIYNTFVELILTI
jgi:hypothetical protein